MSIVELLRGELMRKPALTVLAAAVVATLTPISASATSGRLDWGACPEDVTKPGLECATLDVPLDYRDPGGQTITIAISRLASTNPEKRRGVLLTNSGGPGGSGLDFPAALRDLGMPQDVLDSYDVIGMDPRGVGRSTPVTCDLTLAEQPTNIPMYARNPAAVEEEAERVAAVAEKCGSSPTAPLLPHITTANTARDMDRVREALGEPAVSYFGISYGTYLGSVYTAMFPQRSDRFLIDSATGPDGWDSEFSRSFGQGFEDRFPDFAEFAAANPEYGLGETPEQVAAKYFELAARLDETPSPDGYNGQAFRFATFAALYYDRELPRLAETWHALDTGTPVPAPDSSAVAAAAPADNYQASQLHVICNDSDWPEDVRTYQRNVEVDRFRHPMFGAAGANITPCAFWPSEPVEPQVEITDEGPSNVLIIQNLRDPATPLAGARKLREAFGDRARMVTADQGGHLAYLFLDDQCVHRIATNFLVNGERPGHDLACGKP
ncbi:alpha/beta hydrolase [Saccharopolyspora sp. WRP15-2]|uniref:Alpha/beta hydrolase n=1 Tax=Saccharopolyspora oryzae TaxID=2997343 RepID=A0ABT4UW42_9PSEU|nr:alpha/beta hydrolase [Saccharopolyspora oryzae]MDA3625894.1 alpha/beta hydrolase [Saccharopolyspora oryzae]